MAQLPQGLLHVLRVVNGQVNTARTVVPVVVFLNRLADRRGVDDGQHLLDVLGDEAEVQHLITVVHVVEVQVLRQVVRLRRVLGVNPLELVGDRHDSRRQQALPRLARGFVNTSWPRAAILRSSPSLSCAY